MQLSRRRFIAGVGGALTLRVSAETPVGFDLDDPEENLRAFVKLIGSLDGEPVYDTVRGSVYGLIAGRPAQPLFRTVGAGVAVFTQKSPLEFSAMTRYVGLLLDWETGQPLQRWMNPFTNRECAVPVTRYGPGEVRVLGDRMIPTSVDSTTGMGATRPWYRLGDVVHMQRDVIQSSVKRPLFPKADLMTYSGDWHLLADPAVKRMPSQLNFAAVESWREWMGMDASEYPGTSWWHVSGAKLDAPSDYSPVLRDWITQQDPTFFAQS